MNYKTAQELGGRQTIDVKKEELQKIITDALEKLNNTFKQTQDQLTQQMVNEINAITQELTLQVEKKLNELKGPTVIV